MSQGTGTPSLWSQIESLLSEHGIHTRVLVQTDQEIRQSSPSSHSQCGNYSRSLMLLGLNGHQRLFYANSMYMHASPGEKWVVVGSQGGRQTVLRRDNRGGGGGATL